MANEILTTDVVLNYTLAEFSNNIPFMATASRATEREFTQGAYKFGDTVNIRRFGRSIYQQGQVLAFQSYTEQSEPLTIAFWPGRLINFTSFDLTLKVDQFYDRVMRPHVISIANQCEQIIAQQAALQLYQFEGSAAAPLNSFRSVDVANARLNLMAVNEDYERMLAISEPDSFELKSALVNFFNPTLNENISQRSALGHLGSFDVFHSQNIAIQTAGSPGAGPITTTAVVSSGNVIPMTGLAASTVVFRAGDVFSIAGVEAINPITFSSYGRDMQFVVTSDVTSTGGGTANVPVSPTIISDPANSFRNVSNPIPSGAVVTPVGSHNVNVAYDKTSLDIAMPPLDRLVVPESSVMSDPQLHVYLRLSIAGDVPTSVNAYRLDCLLGVKWHPEYAVRLLSRPSFGI